MTTKGVLIFAKSNQQFNYIKQAEVAAAMAKFYLGKPVSLITVEDEYKDNTSDVWDQVIFLDNVHIEENHRAVYIDNKAEKTIWYNLDRLLAYDLSPYDETLLIDGDYLIQNGRLNEIWGNVEPCLLYTSPSPRDATLSRMPSSA